MNHEKNAAYTQIRVTVEALRKLATARAAQNDLHLANLLTAEEFRLRSALAQFAALDSAPAVAPTPARAPVAPPAAQAAVSALARTLGTQPVARPTTEADCLLALADTVQEAVVALDRVDQAWEDLIAHRGVAKPEDEDPAYVAYPSTFPNLQTLRRTLGSWGDALKSWGERLRRGAAPEPEKA